MSVEFGLLDELLHQDVDIGALKRLDHGLRGLHRVAQHHADALGAFEQLDDHRCAADEVDDVLGLAWVVRIGRDRETDAAPRQELHAA